MNPRRDTERAVCCGSTRCGCVREKERKRVGERRSEIEQVRARNEMKVKESGKKSEEKSERTKL